MLNTPYSIEEIREKMQELAIGGATEIETITPDAAIDSDRTFLIKGNEPIVLRALVPVYDEVAIANSRRPKDSNTDSAGKGRKSNIVLDG